MTIDDLLCRVVLRPDSATGEEQLVMELQPFAAAFKEGHWLLLDELNLAPDTVLQVRQRGCAAQKGTLIYACCTGRWHQGQAQGSSSRCRVVRDERSRIAVPL